MNSFVLCYLFTLLASNLLSVSSLEVMNICAYSADPSKYKPNCYDCPNVVYKNSLTACLNMDSLPKNITFDAANCMEQNCLIPYPNPTPSGMEKEMNFFESISKLVFANPVFFPGFAARYQRSVGDNSVDSSDQTKIHVVGHVQTFVTSFPDKETEFGEPEYNE